MFTRRPKRERCRRPAKILKQSTGFELPLRSDRSRTRRIFVGTLPEKLQGGVPAQSKEGSLHIRRRHPAPDFRLPEGRGHAAGKIRRFCCLLAGKIRTKLAARRIAFPMISTDAAFRRWSSMSPSAKPAKPDRFTRRPTICSARRGTRFPADTPIGSPCPKSFTVPIRNISRWSRASAWSRIN